MQKQEVVADALKEIVRRLDDTNDAKKANSLYAALAGGPGIFGLGNHVYAGLPLSTSDRSEQAGSLESEKRRSYQRRRQPFRFPFNFPEEFITVYRLHPLLPDLIEYREWNKELNVIRHKCR